MDSATIAGTGARNLAGACIKNFLNYFLLDSKSSFVIPHQKLKGEDRSRPSITSMILILVPTGEPQQSVHLSVSLKLVNVAVIEHTDTHDGRPYQSKV